ncbi:hypothetical protein GCM10007937_22640 [Mesorhizobium albiziae]|nr:hypothetical protein GCM10007937_22640 [Mesorhizobium albiziae]
MTLGGQEEWIEEVELIQLIRCELHYGVQQALDAFPKTEEPNTGYNLEWLRDWESKLSLKITVDERSTLSPGVTYKEPLRNAVSQFQTTIPQNFSASVGLHSSAQATRVETIGFSYKFADLLAEGRLKKGDCQKRIRNKVIVSDFKIGDFLMTKAFVANHTDAVVQNGEDSPYSTFTYDTTFIITYGGNITPVWNLIHITANSTSPLYNAVRSKTHNLTMTLGRVGSSQAAAVANANLIGQAVARALDDR